jgi:CheY-like chemotaxis protein
VQTDHGSLLVVDDQQINRDMLSRHLERRGYTVAVAGDECQAMKMITTQKFDLVLLFTSVPPEVATFLRDLLLSSTSLKG